jgi:acetone carboxylase beta subunit
LFEDSLRNALLGQILGKGYGPESFTLLSYGGGGPLHVGGYSDGLAFEDILVPAWAPAFSAFGCACGDYEYRFDRTLDLPLRPADGAADRERVAREIDSAWRSLREQAAAEFAKSGVAPGDILFKPAVRMLYFGQLNDLEVPSPAQQLSSGSDLELLTRGFEELYGRMYGLAARTPQFGYLITGAFMSASVEVEKPRLPEEEEQGPTLPRAAFKPARQIYWRDRWHEATILELDAIKAGNVVVGPAVVEAPACTVIVPPGRSARLDRHRIFHMSVSAPAGRTEQ